MKAAMPTPGIVYHPKRSTSWKGKKNKYIHTVLSQTRQMMGRATKQSCTYWLRRVKVTAQESSMSAGKSENVQRHEPNVYRVYAVMRPQHLNPGLTDMVLTRARVSSECAPTLLTKPRIRTRQLKVCKGGCALT